MNRCSPYGVKIYRQGTFESFYDMPLEVNWPLTDMCNYRCSYCFGQHPVDKTRFSDLKQIENAVANISKISRGRIMVTLAGGEPTIHPHFLDLLYLLREKLQERLKGILIISNGSNSGEFYEKIADFSKDVNIKQEISIHTEFVKIQHIVELIKMLSRRINLEFPLMFNPEKKELVYDLYDKLLELRKQYPFHIIVQTLRQPPKFDVLDYRYTEEDFLWQREAQERFEEASRTGAENVCRARWESGFPKNFFWDVFDGSERRIVTELDRNKAFQMGYLKFKDMYCVQGSSVLSIGWDGSLRRSHCGVENAVLNIYEDISSEEMNRAYVLKCPYENCGCGTNHPIPKFLDEEEALSFVKTHLHR